jgi:sugar O-acyltransferase (sialic acid O-acetyltransferase NeuD family)
MTPATAAVTPPLVLLGAGGHAKVLLSLAQAAGYAVVGVCDPGLARESVPTWRGLPVLGGDEALARLDPTATGLINGVGQLPGDQTRRNLFAKCRNQGFHFPPLLHPSAWVDPSASLAEGVQIMAGAVIQADCRIGENTIINTRASIDHDGEIGAHVHVAPGATLCGGVKIGEGAFIGAGATVVHGIRIGADSFLRAGRLQAVDLPDSTHGSRSDAC